MSRKRILIVGAGVCGMTVGHELAQAGFEVTIVEIQAQIGGLAKTYRYDGFSFDSGPHVFLSANPEVKRFVARVMSDDLRTARMRGAVHFLGRYYEWPLTPRVILGLPPKVVLLVARDIFMRLFQRRQIVPANFEEYVLQKYGRTLYELDFGPYTEKFTKLPGTEIHSDWAILGVSRTVISEKVATGSLGQVIRMALRPRQAPLLLYPRQGISSFHARLADAITKRGGRILVQSRVDRFQVDGGRIVGARIAPDGLDEPCDIVVWTGPLPEACRLLGAPEPDLRYLAIVIYNISLRGRPKRDYQWIYYVDPALPFNRVYNTVLFSSESAPPDHHGLCVEVSCREGDEVWRDPASLTEKVLNALAGVDLIDPQEVIAVHHEKLANAYPVYRTNYRGEQQRGLLGLQGVANLLVAGRTGRFWYNTMDHSIENAFEVAKLVRGH
jgi:protoporphyrinogen oxidase